MAGGEQMFCSQNGGNLAPTARAHESFCGAFLEKRPYPSRPQAVFRRPRRRTYKIFREGRKPERDYKTHSRSRAIIVRFHARSARAERLKVHGLRPRSSRLRAGGCLRRVAFREKLRKSHQRASGVRFFSYRRASVSSARAAKSPPPRFRPRRGSRPRGGETTSPAASRTAASPA